MAFFGIFNRKELEHPSLGKITYSFGKWQGNNATLFNSGPLKILIPGNKTGPSDKVIENLRNLEKCYPILKNEIAKKMFEEYQAGKEAFDNGEFEGLLNDYPKIDSPENIWNYIKILRVCVNAYSKSYGKEGLIEIAYETAWDSEHIKGVLFADCKLIEYCGSVR